MSVKLRLTRRGAKKRPFYWVVAAHSRAPRDGRFLEKLGTYNPMLAKDADKRIVLVEERVRHWLSVGAEPSDRVARMLHEKGILEAPPVRREQTKKPMPKAKAQERLREAEEAATAAEQAKQEAAQESAQEAQKPEAEADSSPEAKEATEASTEATGATTEAKEAPTEATEPEAKEAATEATEATTEATEAAPADAPSPEADTAQKQDPKEDSK